MTYTDGLAAINLERSARVPHTESFLLEHWGIVKEITGIAVNPLNPQDGHDQSAVAMMRALNFDLRYNMPLNKQVFGERITTMPKEDALHASEQTWRIDCPFSSPEEVLRFNFQRAYGTPDVAEWKAKFEQDYQQRVQETPDLINSTGVDITLLSGMLAIFGWQMLLMASGTDLEAFGALTERYTAWVMPYFQALAEADIPLALVEDDFVWNEGPFFPAGWYDRYIYPNYKKLFAPVRESGKKILFSSRGNYTQFIEQIADCGVHGFVLGTHNDLAAIAEKYGPTHVLIGNADPRALQGSYTRIETEVKRCMEIGKPYPGFFFALGGDLPRSTPVENVLHYLDTYEAMSHR